MTTEAERLATAFDTGDFTICEIKAAAALLRQQAADIERLSALADKWNDECDEFREDNKRLESERDKANTLLRQALEALESADLSYSYIAPPHITNAIATIKQHLGEV